MKLQQSKIDKRVKNTILPSLHPKGQKKPTADTSQKNKLCRLHASTYFLPVANRETLKYSSPTSTDRFAECGISVFVRERLETELVSCANKAGRILEFKNSNCSIEIIIKYQGVR